MTVRVKICGLKDERALEAALDAGAAYVGFVFFPKSPRHLDIDVAAGLAARARGRATIVAVTVDADDGLVGRLRDALAPDYIQLHGHETPARAAEIKRLSGAGIVKAIPVATPADVAAADAFRDIVDFVLYDAQPPKVALLPGGNGLAFDRRALDGVGGPFFLSGGLDADNVAAAVAELRPFAVDVSSGVERAPGEKDADLIARFVAAATRPTALAS